MQFETLADTYKESSKYASLSDNTKRVYNKQIEYLVELGGKLPMSDAHMSDRVARSRSPKGKTWTLGRIWSEAIDTAKLNGKEEIEASQKNMLLTVLKLIYAWAESREVGIIKPIDNPTNGLRRWVHTPTEHAPVTEEEIDKVYAWAKGGKLSELLTPYAYLAVFAFDTGVRPENLYTHEQTWFKRKDGKVYFEVRSMKRHEEGKVAHLAKLGQRSLDILEWFKKQPKVLGAGSYTFRTDKGRAFQQASVSVYWREVCKAVDIEQHEFYDNKRGLGTKMAAEGKDALQISYRLGITRKAAEKYTRPTMLQKADAYEE